MMGDVCPIPLVLVWCLYDLWLGSYYFSGFPCIFEICVSKGRTRCAWCGISVSLSESMVFVIAQPPIVVSLFPERFPLGGGPMLNILNIYPPPLFFVLSISRSVFNVGAPFLHKTLCFKPL